MSVQVTDADLRKQQGEIQAMLAKSSDQVKEYATQANVRMTEMEQEIAKLGHNVAAKYVHGGAVSSNPVVAAIRGEALAPLKERRTREVFIPVEASIHAALTGDGAFKTQPQIVPGVAGAPSHPLSILAALPRIVTTAGTFQFNQLTNAFAYAADYQVNEGDTKPDQALPTNLVTVPIATVAVLSGVSEQVVMDQPAIEGQLNNLLMYGVQQKLEAEVVAGNGGTGKITGLLNSGTAFAPKAGSADVDAISECAAHLQSIGWNPNAVMLSPADWHAMRTSKAAGSGEYLSGSYDMPPAPNLWGCPHKFRS